MNSFCALLFFRNDEKFRKYLQLNVPGIEPVLKVVLQEEGNALDEATKSISQTTKKVTDLTSTVTGYFSGTKLDEPSKPSAIASTKRNAFFFFVTKQLQININGLF